VGHIFSKLQVVRTSQPRIRESNASEYLDSLHMYNTDRIKDVIRLLVVAAAVPLQKSRHLFSFPLFFPFTHPFSPCCPQKHTHTRSESLALLVAGDPYFYFLLGKKEKSLDTQTRW